jgi:hypothetical protein
MTTFWPDPYCVLINELKNVSNVYEDSDISFLLLNMCL